MSWQTDLYDSIEQGVFDLTKRDDLEAETRMAIRAATRNAHLSESYYRDCVVTQVQLPNSSNQLGLDIPTLFPNCRGFSDIKPIDQNFNLIMNGLNQNERLIEIVELGDIYDPQYGSLRTNIAYASGSSLVIRSPINCWGYAVSWFKAPQTSRELYDSWIAQMAPDIIEMWAAALVYSADGNDEKARTFLDLIQKFQLPTLKANFLLSSMR